MHLWDVFFTTQTSESPHLGGVWYILLLSFVLGIFYASYRFRACRSYQTFFKDLQLVQLFALYTWYWGNFMPLSESLPLYHCRIAMFVLLFVRGNSWFKDYFALLGTFGATVAFIYPVFDAYPFPHVTILSFIVGHFALLGNALIYLFQDAKQLTLSFTRILWTTLSLNLLILLANLLTGGSYGFLRNPPLIGNQGLVLNFLLISFVLVAAVALTQTLFVLFLKRKEELIIEKG